VHPLLSLSIARIFDIREKVIACVLFLDCVFQGNLDMICDQWPLTHNYKNLPCAHSIRILLPYGQCFQTTQQIDLKFSSHIPLLHLVLNYP
jgi:hypothetical protein